MKCPMCGYIFNEEQAAAACKECIMPKLYKGCKLAKCPNCGYEMPLEPKWIKKFLGK